MTLLTTAASASRWWLRLATALTAAVALAALSDANPAGSSSGLQQRFSRAHFEFSLALYSALVDVYGTPSSDGYQRGASDNREAGNLVFSPFSVSTVLAMVFLGAGSASNTSLQLRSALRLDNLSFQEVRFFYVQHFPVSLAL